ncbi:MAG: carbohydrate ABC transporter permease [Clostridia bacterium]|nr:carbohydrate ABC transporter permease [Clostridia bacterium]
MKPNSLNTIAKILINLILVILSLACIIPFAIVVSSSLTDQQAIIENGYNLFPKVFSTLAYQYILADPSQIAKAYGVTILVTVVGTAMSLLISACFAYVLSRRDFPYRNKLSLFLFITMIFNGGLVPGYILVAQVLHLKNTVWSLILPYLVIPFFILLLKTYFGEIPFSLVESAKIEGAGELQILFKIVLPLSLPAIATVGLFIILQYWNDWFLALLYIDDADLNPLQYLLYLIMQNLNAIRMSPMQGMLTAQLPGENARMAMAVLATGPIVFAFMFVQKYFISGLTVGAIKG